MFLNEFLMWYLSRFDNVTIVNNNTYSDDVLRIFFRKQDIRQ